MTETKVWQALQEGHITLNEACRAVAEIIRRRQHANNSLAKGATNCKTTNSPTKEKAQTHSSKREAKRKENDLIRKAEEIRQATD